MIKKQYFYALVAMNLLLVCMVLFLCVFCTYSMEIVNGIPHYINSTAAPQETTQLVPAVSIVGTEPSIVGTEPSIIEPTTEPTETIIVEPRYNFTDDDYYLLAQLLCGEDSISGDGEYDFVWRNKLTDNYYVEMSKVLCIVMNRQRSSQFPNTVKEVILQKGQFTVMPNNYYSTPNKLAVEEIQRWCEDYNNYDPKVQVIPEDHLYCCAGKNNTTITRKNFR